MHDHASSRTLHSHGESRVSPSRALKIALSLTLAFFVVEVLAGLWSGSLALLADAGHMLADGGALFVSLAVARIASRPRSSQKTYGYRRAEVIGALINATTLGVGAVFVVVEALHRLDDPPPVRGGGVLGVATGGLVVNLLAAWFLSRSAKDNLNVRSALVHVLGDALGSVAAMGAGALVMAFGWRVADPVASMLIATLLMWGSLRLLREVTHVLMEGTPAGIDLQDLERTIRETGGVASVHDLHVWTLTPGETMLTAHVVLQPETHGAEVARRVGDRIGATYGIHHVTIQPEAPSPQLVQLRLSQDT